MNFYTIYSKIKSLYSYLILLMGKKKAAPDITITEQLRIYT